LRWTESRVNIGPFRADITERRRAEEVRERLAAVVDSSSDAIISKTPAMASSLPESQRRKTLRSRLRSNSLGESQDSGCNPMAWPWLPRSASPGMTLESIGRVFRRWEFQAVMTHFRVLL